MTGALFPRNFRKAYPEAVRGEGCFLFSADGKKILDASGGAAVVSIGHGVESVARAMGEQARTLAYVHSSQFVTRAAGELARRILDLAPKNFRESPDGPGRVFFTSGGSEATETALKLCRQYYLERGQPARTQFLSRWQSYHGSTLGALAVSGNIKRRTPFAPLLRDWSHIHPCYCYRCPLRLHFPDCHVACADELDAEIAKQAPGTVAAFLVEPVSGATLGAVSPPDGYLQRIAEICRRRDILLIADEVMTGLGRTGKPFAVEHWGVEPDIILVGKGIASGYAPLGAVIVTGRIAHAMEKGSGIFLHGFTYSAHPVATAAGLAVFDYIAEKDLFHRVSDLGKELRAALEPLKQNRIVGDVRGLGLLLGIEFVRDAKTREPFPADAGIAGKIYNAALERGILTYPIQGCVDGARGDHILLAPPFVISSEEIQFLANKLGEAINAVAKEIS
ncbi:MAG TPA: aspartate aminotransferase family protein [Candidatus Acidoferrales bacterium]|nr:aspartate aminotransferase family protein [Candidatus Acidoferrales bacterium]